MDTADLDRIKQEVVRDMAARAPATGSKFERPVTEFKVVNGLSVLRDDRKEFRAWQEQLKDALSQVGEEFGDLIEALDTTAKTVLEEQLEE